MRFIILNSIILLVLDFYIYKALRGTNIKWAQSKTFTMLWWGYSTLLFLGIFATVYLDIRLTVRSIVLVAFFITFVSKLVYALVFLIDDARRGGVWLKRRLLDRPVKPKEVTTEATVTRIVPASGPKISRSDFLAKSGLAIAAVPFTTLSWGIVSGAYDYRIRRQKIYLPNLPKA